MDGFPQVSFSFPLFNDKWPWRKGSIKLLSEHSLEKAPSLFLEVWPLASLLDDLLMKIYFHNSFA